MDITKKMELNRKTPVLSLSEYLNEDNGFQIRMEDFDAELASAYKDSTGHDMTSTVANSGDSKSSGGVSGTSIKRIDELAKKLREQGVKNVETSDFLKKDGSVKSTLPEKFVEKWTNAATSVDKDFSYFFYDGGLYWIRSKKTSTATPCNWPKWKSAVDAASDVDNSVNFIKNYTSYIGSFGGMNMNASLDAITKINSSNDKGGRPKTIGAINTLILYPQPFISKDNLEKIGKIVDKFCDDDNWEWEDYTTFNNILVVLGNLITFDPGSDKFVSAFKWICDNSKMSEKGPYLFKDTIYSGPNSNSDEQILTIEKKPGNFEVVAKSYDEIEDYPAKYVSEVPEDFKKIQNFVQITPKGGRIPSIKSVLCSNISFLTRTIYPALKIHLARINAAKGESLPGNTKWNKVIQEL